MKIQNTSNNHVTLSAWGHEPKVIAAQESLEISSECYVPYARAVSVLVQEGILKIVTEAAPVIEAPVLPVEVPVVEAPKPKVTPKPQKAGKPSVEE